MNGSPVWVDLLDPDAQTLEQAWPGELFSLARDLLLAPARHGDEPRAKFESHDSYVFGVLVLPIAVPDEDRVFHQEIDILLAADRILTVRKSPPPAPGSRRTDPPYDPAEVQKVLDAGEAVALPGTICYLIADDVAEGFLSLLDDIHEEIDELEDQVEEATNEHMRSRISELRHDMLHLRRTLSPTRDAIRRIVDGRADGPGADTLPRELELQFGNVYDKLLRASEGLESARDLIGSVRDYHQAKVANDQNEVMKRFTVIASMLLLPTFIVGLYGQNFRHIPELGWAQGYGFSWFLILGSTAGQLAWFRYKRWI